MKHDQSRDPSPRQSSAVHCHHRYYDLIRLLTSHHLSFPQMGYTSATLYPCYYSKTQAMEMMQDLPSSNTNYPTIPLPLRREKISSHIQSFKLIYCLHHKPSGSTFPSYSLRRSSIHVMLQTSRLHTLTLLTGRQVMTDFIQCNALHTASTYNITIAVGHMLHGSLILP